MIVRFYTYYRCKDASKINYFQYFSRFFSFEGQFQKGCKQQMDILINHDGLEAMNGLPHIQQLTYLRGIRPYMDVKTGTTGIKRRISYQSISEQLYIEPHQGIKSQNFSRDQVRRAASGLVRAGVIEVQSDGMQLILKCPLAWTLAIFA